MADDNHIIRVIIQGYNKLSGVLKDAVDKAGPELDKLDKKLQNNQRSADRTANEFSKMSKTVDRDGKAFDDAGSRADKFAKQIRNLGIETKKYNETAEQMFDRLRKEGNAPRQGPGFSPFQSRTDFVNQENERRRREQVEQQKLIAKTAESFRKEGTEADSLRVKLEKLDESIGNIRKKAKDSQTGGTFGSGFKIGKDISRDDDTEIAKRLQNARRFRTIQEREINLDAKKQKLEAEQANKRQVIEAQKQLDIDRTRRNREIDDLKERSAIRQEEIKKEIDAAKELKNTSSVTPERAKVLHDEIASQEKLIRDEEAALRNRTNVIKTEKEVAIERIQERKVRLQEIYDDARLKRDDRQLSKQDRAENRKVAQDARRNITKRNNDIKAEQAESRQLIADARKAADIKIQAAQESLDKAKQEIKGGKNSPEDIAAANALIRDQERVLKEEKDNLKTRIDAINREHTEAVSTKRASLSETLKNDRLRIERIATEAKNAIPGSPTRADVIRDFHTDRNNDIAGLTGVEKTAAKAAFAIEDFKRGINGGRRDLADFRGEALKEQSTFAKLGNDIGKATSNINKFVNVKWSLVIGFIQTLGTLVVEVGANLVSLASSAVFAAGALGGALVAGLAQAVPAVGLLAATFHELQNAIKVVQLRQRANNMAGVDAAAQAKAQKSAVQQLADAHYALKQAQQGVSDADKGIVDAHQRVADALNNEKDAAKGLAQARKDAAKAIVDAAFAERDAELSLRDANLSVLDAKQQLKDFEDKQRLDKSQLGDAQAAVKEAQDRLAEVKKQGDIVEIAQATSQLNAAKDNVSTIQDSLSNTELQHKQLQLGVDQSIQRQKEARVTLHRARQENATRQKQGVAGSPEVAAALDNQKQAARQYRDAVQGVTDAERRRVDAEHAVGQALIGISNAQDSVKESSDKMSAAQRNAQREFNKLSLPEKKFVQAVERLIREYKKIIRPLTDIITSAFTRLINSIIVVLKDPKIIAALHGLAVQIGKGIDRFGKFLEDPETRRQLTLFITEAAKNMPKIVDLFFHLLKIVMNIAEAAAPLFSTLLGGADSLLSRAEKWTNPKGSPATGGVRPDDRGGVRGIDSPQVRRVSPLDKFLQTANKNLTSWLHLIGAITRFFTYLFGGAQASGNSLVGQLTKAFNAWADWIRDHPQKVHKFFEDMRQALTGVAKILAKLAVGLLHAFSSKNAQAFTEFMLTIVIPALLLMIGAVQQATAIFIGLTKVPVVGSFVKWAAQFILATALLTKLFPILKVVTGNIKLFYKAISGGLTYLARFVSLIRAQGLITTLTELGSGIFPNLAKAVTLVGRAFTALFISSPVGWIALAVVAIVLLLRHFHLLWPAIRLIENAFKSAFNWIKDHWKLLIAIILGPLGLIIDAVVTHWDDLKKIFTAAYHFIAGVMKKLGKTIYDEFVGGFKQIANWALSIGSWLYRHVFYVFRGRVTTEIGIIAKSIFDGFISGFTKIADWFKGIGSWLKQHIIDPFLKFFGIHSPSTLMFDIGMDIVHGLLNAIKKLPHLVLDVVKGIPGLIIGVFKGIGGKIANVIKSGAGALKSAGDWLLGKLGVGGSSLGPKAEHLLTLVKVLGGEFTRLRQRGVSKEDAIKAEKKRHPGLKDSQYEALANAAGYATGGPVRPDDRAGKHGVAGSDTVPAWLTPGEWILNKAQQLRLAQRLHMSVEAARMFIFGSKGASPHTGTVSGRGVVSENGRQEPFLNFTLATNTDSTGAIVHFIQLRDGTWGQVTAKAARRIRATNGNWLPGYVSRANKHLAAKGFGNISQGFSRGGVVSFASPAMRYASGGAIRGGMTNIPSSLTNIGSRHLNQNFDVKVVGDTDWSYVFALGAQKAQESY